jgi:hypothetical protein
MPMAFMFHPFWILLIILGFWAWWPLGLVALGCTIGRRRMACGYRGGMNHWDSKMQRMQDKMDRVRAKMESFGGGRDWWGSPPTSGNRAFDDYRTETLKRLEEEQVEFRDFLSRLRFAKDKTEFDQFMAERRNRTPDTGPQPQN